MLMILSPAKRLDFESPTPAKLDHTTPEFLEDAEMLVRKLRRFSRNDLAELFDVSDDLAEQNRRRFAEWQTPFTPENARPALLAFQGDVYQGLQAEEFSKRDIQFAQKHLRILSGLYGVLRPLDLIQPYRLEMGTRLPTRRGKDLYEFWGEKITRALEEAMGGRGEPALVNLASNEYFKAVRPAALPGRVVTPVFKDAKKGRYRVVGLFAKRARGLMASYAIRNRVEKVEDLKSFDGEGYAFRDDLSSASELVFTREET